MTPYRRSAASPGCASSFTTGDHAPAHVHVIGPGWVVVVDLHRPELREVVDLCSKRDARRVLDMVAEHGTALPEGWKRFHG